MRAQLRSANTMISIRGSFYDLNDQQVGSAGFSFHELRWPKSLTVNDIVFLENQSSNNTE